MENQTLRHVPWTCFWGSFDPDAVNRDPSGDRCFWRCRRPGVFDAPRPLLRDECEGCVYWQPAVPPSPATSPDNPTSERPA